MCREETFPIAEPHFKKECVLVKSSKFESHLAVMYLASEAKWQVFSLRRDKVIETSPILLKLRQDDRLLIRFSLELTHSPTLEGDAIVQ